MVSLTTDAALHAIIIDPTSTKSHAVEIEEVPDEESDHIGTCLPSSDLKILDDVLDRSQNDDLRSQERPPNEQPMGAKVVPNHKVTIEDVEYEELDYIGEPLGVDDPLLLFINDWIDRIEVPDGNETTPIPETTASIPKSTTPIPNMGSP